MTKFARPAAMAATVLLLAGCSELTGPTGPSITVEEQLQVLTAYNETNPYFCGANWERLSNLEGEQEGAEVQMCGGQNSGDMPYVVTLFMTDGVNAPAGTVTVIYQPSTQPMAYMHLNDLIYDLTGISDGENKEDIRDALFRAHSAGNMPPPATEWLPVSTPDSGFQFYIAPQMEAPGFLSVKAVPQTS